MDNLSDSLSASWGSCSTTPSSCSAVRRVRQGSLALIAWKVFASRFMRLGISVLAIDVGLIVAEVIGSMVPCDQIWLVFSTSP